MVFMSDEIRYRFLFRFAALYNIVAGVATIVAPQAFFRLFGLPDINHAYVMSGLGMFVAVYGIGFYLVSMDLRRYHHFALLGLVGKSCGVLGWWYHTIVGTIPVAALWTNVCNDLVWIPLFIVYLRWHRRTAS